jgi:hypothetical protein
MRQDDVTPKKYCDCGCKTATYRGLLFIDWSSGYVTQAAECDNCGRIGQIPSMVEPEALHRFTKHPDCIEVNKRR